MPTFSRGPSSVRSVDDAAQVRRGARTPRRRRRGSASAGRSRAGTGARAARAALTRVGEHQDRRVGRRLGRPPRPPRARSDASSLTSAKPSPGFGSSLRDRVGARARPAARGSPAAASATRPRAAPRSAPRPRRRRSGSRARAEHSPSQTMMRRANRPPVDRIRDSPIRWGARLRSGVGASRAGAKCSEAGPSAQGRVPAGRSAASAIRSCTLRGGVACSRSSSATSRAAPTSSKRCSIAPDARFGADFERLAGRRPGEPRPRQPARARAGARAGRSAGRARCVLGNHELVAALGRLGAARAAPHRHLRGRARVAATRDDWIDWLRKLPARRDRAPRRAAVRDGARRGASRLGSRDAARDRRARRGAAARAIAAATRALPRARIRRAIASATRSRA